MHILIKFLFPCKGTFVKQNYSHTNTTQHSQKHREREGERVNDLACRICLLAEDKYNIDRDRERVREM